MFRRWVEFSEMTSSRTARAILTILIIASLACFVALMVGCQTRYEPPGQELWRAL